jgi:hypothetical protein
LPESIIDRSCGPSGCEVDWLSSERHAVDDDVAAFTRLATDAGWGDGLPLVPPTEARVREAVAASGRYPDELLAELPPRQGRATVEKLAVNAVMAGAPAAAMPLLCAAVEAMADPAFNLFALNTTTSCVVPAMLVNGPSRDRLGIPYGPGCFGGVAGPSPAIGRAIRLLMRNVAGQVVGVTSKSVFGQPGRVAGIVAGEWEERSPWPPLAERRGVAGDAVTVHGASGTFDLADIVADSAADLLAVIGASIAVPCTNAMIGPYHGAQMLVALCPPWAELIAAGIADLAEVQAELWQRAWFPADRLPPAHRAAAEQNRRVDGDGRIHAVAAPQDLLIAVCGGLGNLHALWMPTFGPTRAVTRGFAPAEA